MRHLLKWLLLLLILISSGLIFATYSNIGGIMFSFNKNHRKVQKLLNIKLPEDVAELHYFRWQPNRQLSYYCDYIMFRTSKEMFIALMLQMNMEFHKPNEEGTIYLPTSWQTEPGLTLDWWDPSPDTPNDSAARSFGATGWIVAKYERGIVYMIVTDADFADDLSILRK